MRKYLVPSAALLGVLIAGVVVFNSSHKVEPVTPVVSLSAMPQPPYAHYIAATGQVEASTGDIAVGSPVSGVIQQIYVKVGDRIARGAPLLKIDDRLVEAQLKDALAKVQEAEAALRKPIHDLEYAESLAKRDKSAVSIKALSDLRDKVALARASLKRARSEVATLKAEIDLHTVPAPVSGEVLQIIARVGEFTQGGDILGSPIMLLGGDENLSVRTRIDEYDAWRFHSDAKAMAFLRSNAAISTPLSFDYLEPHVIPKTSLSGAATERTDTRVLEVLYRILQPDFPVYVGQQVDVFIEVPDEPGVGRGSPNDAALRHP